LTPPGDPDAVLCRRAAAGDRGAFRLLVETHERRLRAFLRQLAGPDLADELAQEAFLRAWQSLHGFRDEAKFSSWLCAIGWRLFVDHKRRERSEGRKRDAAAELAEREEAPSAGARVDLGRALALLEPAEKAALVLCDGHGWSHEEAAEILRLPLGTLKGTVRRAKRKCREYLR
jgi:RNA polymerase sigma-70 factor (ECF subfamily)